MAGDRFSYRSFSLFPKLFYHEKYFFRGVILFHRIAVVIEDAWLFMSLLNNEWAVGAGDLLARVFGFSPQHAQLFVGVYQWLRSLAFLFWVLVRGFKRMCPVYTEGVVTGPKGVWGLVKRLISKCKIFFKKEDESNG